jgi:hypothetical protein
MSYSMQFKSVMTIQNQQFFRVDAGRASSDDIAYSKHLNGGTNQ